MAICTYIHMTGARDGSIEIAVEDRHPTEILEKAHRIANEVLSWQRWEFKSIDFIRVSDILWRGAISAGPV